MVAAYSLLGRKMAAETLVGLQAIDNLRYLDIRMVL